MFPSPRRISGGEGFAGILVVGYYETIKISFSADILYDAPYSRNIGIFKFRSTGLSCLSLTRTPRFTLYVTRDLAMQLRVIRTKIAHPLERMQYFLFLFFLSISITTECFYSRKILTLMMYHNYIFVILVDLCLSVHSGTQKLQFIKNA